VKTVCAASVLHGREAFAGLGEVVVRPDRAISAADLRDADALVVRSKTRVDAALVGGSRLAFVGTATAGYDHLDVRALADRGIAWCAAAGCNANSVSEYVASALLHLSARHAWPLAGRSIAVVGVGQVGRRVVAKARALGLRPLLNDPPRQQAEGGADWRALDEILPEADVVTLHVPLVDDGPWPTRGLADGRFFERMKPGAWFINASRGEVVDEEDLRLALDGGQVARAVLDVWAREPEIDPALLARVDLGTPHIAGYSYDGKLRGTVQVYEELCRFLEVAPDWTPGSLSPPPAVPEIVADGRGLSDEEILWGIVRRVYDVAEDDGRLRAPAADAAALAARFEDLRRTYPDRREFPGTTVRAAALPPALRGAIAGLGFGLE
jgi:erythronate-4-phosphate dehydrogenase